jgi:hypothetical protein
MPPVIVDAIPREAPKHNLIDSAVHLDPPSGEEADRWLQGFTWTPEPCYEASVYDPTCGEVIDLDAEVGNMDPRIELPLVVYMPYDCVANGFEFEEDEDKVKRRLEAASPKAVESLFWLSTLAENWSLANDTPVAPGDGDPPGGILAGGAVVTPEVALLQLTQALANCGAGSRGMIHAVPYLAQTWANRQYLRIEEVDGVERLTTLARGDIVVVGSGYTGTGPGNTEPIEGTVWAYATPMVGVRLSPIELRPGNVNEIVNHRTNEIRWIAERYVGLQVDDCCAYAVYVDVP